MERRAWTAPAAGCYREFAPPRALAAHVRGLFSFTSRAEPVAPGRRVTLEIQFSAGDVHRSPMFADGHSSLVFDLGPSLRAEESAHDVHGTFIGAMRRVTADHRHELPPMVGVFFRPAQASAFTHLPSDELTDRLVAVQELWGPDALDLCEQLATSNESQRLDLIEAALLRRLAQSREPRAITVDIPGLAREVVRHHGQLSIDSLAESAGVSRQHLTRVFREGVGVSPKLYSRLARFQSALVYARAGTRVDWARVACELGYADQSHMIAEFREFSSLTPHMLATERWYHPFIERAKQRVTEGAVSRV